MALYFAYGSNLEQQDFERWCEKRGHGYGLLDDVVGPAVLDDWALVFGRDGMGRGGGVLDLWPRKGYRVPGVVFEVDRVALAALDKKEGHPNHYERRQVVVEVAGRELECITYVGARAGTKHLAPSASYLDIVRLGYERFGLDTEPLELAARAHLTGTLEAQTPDLFVYGTLQVGERLHHYIEGLGPTATTASSVKGRLFDLGSYPGLSLDGDATISGERLRFEDIHAALTVLDEVEGCYGPGAANNLYKRKVVELSDGPAWTYVYVGPDEGVPIPSGDWRRWRANDGR
jgi:gamma-glutamylcyclotransferase (GGCT)/AIG2-like uncharacterized protein YtfP